MGNQPAFRLNRQALIAALISAAFPIVSHAAAGRVEFAMGNVTALSTDGRERPLTKGTEINTGDTIQTSDGRTQVKFTDGGYISLQPNTQFKVDDYAYEGKADGSEKGFFKLVKGSLRAITGAIGHTNKTAYRINTPVATIGIRGTELTGEYTEEGDNKKLVVHVSHGSVFLENGGGDLILFQGQSGVVTGDGSTPEYSEEGPIVGAAGPDGGTPQQGQEEQQKQQEQANTFMVAEQYNAGGVPNVLGGDTASPFVDDPLTLAAIQGYAGDHAQATYYLDSAATNTGSNSTTNSFQVYNGQIKANFASYQVEAWIAIVNTCGMASANFGSSCSPMIGSITGTRFGGLTGTDNSSGGLCNGPCTFNAAGLFTGPSALNAGMNYTVTGSNIPGGTITGTAGFHAEGVSLP